MDDKDDDDIVIAATCLLLSCTTAVCCWFVRLSCRSPNSTCLSRPTSWQLVTGKLATRQTISTCRDGLKVVNFPVTSPWQAGNTPDTPDFPVTSWRLPHSICYWEVTGKLVPVEFELKQSGKHQIMSRRLNKQYCLQCALKLSECARWCTQGRR